MRSWFCVFFVSAIISNNARKATTPLGSCAVAERPRVLRASLVSFNSTIPRAQSFIINYFGFRFTSAYN